MSIEPMAAAVLAALLSCGVFAQGPAAVGFGAPARVSALPDGLTILRLSLSVPAVAYEGEVSVVAEHGGRRRVKEVLVGFSPPARYRREVMDAFGLPALAIVSDGQAEWVYDRRKGTAWKGEPADADYKLLDPDEEYDLLTRNYEFRAVGEEAVAGRPAWLLEVRSRENGRLTRRLWVDKAYGLVLQRKAYSADGGESSWLRFIRLRIPATVRDEDFVFSPPRGTRVVPSSLKPDYMELDEAATATDMKPRLPRWVPPGYIFESVNLLAYQGATLLHYRYSDGVDVLSLFQCPKDLRVRFRPFSGGSQSLDLTHAKARLALASDGKFLEWDSGDHFILLGDLPVESLRRVAESVP